MTLEKRKRLEWILDALSLGAVLQYAVYRFLQSTMFVFYYSNTYKMITMLLLIVFGGVRWLYLATKKWKERDGQGRKSFFLYCLGAVVLSLPFFYVGWKHDYKFLVFLPICCMCLYDMQAEKVLKAFAWTIGTLLVATVLCSLAGTVRNLTSTGDDGRVVAAYGIINTTDFASYFTFLFLAIWCGMKGKGWKSTVVLAALVAIISYLAYVLTDSRTVIEISAILLLLVSCDCIIENAKNKGIKQFGRIASTLSTVAFPLIGLVVIIFVYSYAQQAPWAAQIDQVLSGRLKVTLDPYIKYGIHPFGNLIEEMHGGGGTLLSDGWSSGYGYLDVAYAMLVIRYGWVITTVVAGLWIWMTVKAIKAGNRRIAFAMALMAIHAFSEARILDINYNIFLIIPFGRFTRSEEKQELEKRRGKVWFTAMSGIILVGAVYSLLPHVLSWLRTLFSFKDWNSGTAAFNSLIVCMGIVTCIYLLWFFLNRVIQGYGKRLVACLTVVVCICAVGVIIANNEINGQLKAREASLDEEENAVRLVQSVATQPVFAAEQEELYKRRFGGFEDHICSTEEVRRGSVFTDFNVEALSIVSAGGMYTVVSDNTGLYSYDSAVINKLAKEGYKWTPYYSGRRMVNLSDAALFNGMKLNEGSLELIGPCRIVTSNMETDQFSGTYEADFKLARVEGHGEIGHIVVLGEAGDRLIKDIEIYDNDRSERVIRYSIGSTPKVSYEIEVEEGTRIIVDEISWNQLSQDTYSAGIEIQPDARVVMTTNVPDNHFNMIHFQLYSIAGEYLCSFGAGYAPEMLNGEYVHGLPSGYYTLCLKGNTNKADEWIQTKVYLEEGTAIHYSYKVEEISEKHIVVKDVVIDGIPIVSYYE